MEVILKNNFKVEAGDVIAWVESDGSLRDFGVITNLKLRDYERFSLNAINFNGFSMADNIEDLINEGKIKLFKKSEYRIVLEKIED